MHLCLRRFCLQRQPPAPANKRIPIKRLASKRANRKGLYVQMQNAFSLCYLQSVICFFFTSPGFQFQALLLRAQVTNKKNKKKIKGRGKNQERKEGTEKMHGKRFGLIKPIRNMRTPLVKSPRISKNLNPKNQSLIEIYIIASWKEEKKDFRVAVNW